MNKSLVLFTTLVLSLFTLSGCIDTGTGSNVGIITKIAKQGVICPTWEAEIVRGGMSNGSGVNGQSFHFTIQDDATAALVQQAMDTQSEVKINYRTEFATMCRSDSPANAFLTHIERLTTAQRPLQAEVTAVTQPKNSEDTITRLLQVQSELIAELAKKQSVSK